MMVIYVYLLYTALDTDEKTASLGTIGRFETTNTDDFRARLRSDNEIAIIICPLASMNIYSIFCNKCTMDVFRRL